jgi:low temperature requirement protein LtrA
MILGGPALFLGGHALFIAVVWRVTPWSQIVAIIVLALLGLVAPHVSAIGFGIRAAAVGVGVAVTDRLRQSHVDTKTPYPEHTTELVQS